MNPRPLSRQRATSIHKPLRGVSSWTSQLLAGAFLVSGLCSPLVAREIEVVLGITPACPYGITACWAGACEALGELEGIKKVAKDPDAYNCTADVLVKDGFFPDPARWQEQLAALVGKQHILRGVEITAGGVLEREGGELVLKLKAGRTLRLGELRHKLQWNFVKQRPRGPEPEEAEAYRTLIDRLARQPKGKPLEVRITGPLLQQDKEAVLEVREFLTFEHDGSEKPE